MKHPPYFIVYVTSKYKVVLGINLLETTQLIDPHQKDLIYYVALLIWPCMQKLEPSCSVGFRREFLCNTSKMSLSHDAFCAIFFTIWLMYMGCHLVLEMLKIHAKIIICESCCLMTKNNGLAAKSCEQTSLELLCLKFDFG